jgi:preprotein translocase subunit SecG
MEAMLLRSLGFAASYGVLSLSWIIAIVVVAAYAWHGPSKTLQRITWWLLGITIIGRIKIAALISYGQYITWKGSAIGQLFLPPTQPWSYYLGYVGLRLWLPVGLSILAAALWFGLATVLNRKSERYFDTGEIPLTTLAVLIAGWPNAVVMVPLAAVYLIAISLARLTILKERLTTLGLPFILALCTALLAADRIRTLFGY